MKSLKINEKRHLELQRELLDLKPKFRTLQELVDYKLAIKVKK